MRLKFPAYRVYREARVAASDSLMALLIGARLGHHALTTSPAHPDVHLPELFGRIAGIERVNRSVADAARLLDESEHHLASMGIPYVLGVHAAFLAEAVSMLRSDGYDEESASWTIAWRADPNEVPLLELHEYVVERSHSALPLDLLDVFHLSRRIRNRIVHFAGTAGSRLPSEYRSLPRPSKERWERIAGRALSIDGRGRLLLGEGELIVVLATTRHLAACVNEILAATLSRDYWAALVVSDYAQLEPQRFGERSQRMRRLLGHSRIFYGGLQLTEDELQAALTSRS
jgi:hypothetical protein